MARVIKVWDGENQFLYVNGQQIYGEIHDEPNDRNERYPLAQVADDLAKALGVEVEEMSIPVELATGSDAPDVDDWLRAQL